MLDDFFVRALIAGSGVAAMAGPLGCFIVWRKMAYFGDTLAHAALLGIALALVFSLPFTVSIFAVALFVAGGLILLQRRVRVGSDALLGLLSHGSLAVGLVVLALLANNRVDLTGLLFGDILAVSKNEVWQILGVAALVLLSLIFIWRPLFAATVSEELAIAEGTKAGRANAIFIVLLALVIAVAMKIVGVLLVTAMLIIPAAAARSLSNTAEFMAGLALVLGLASVWAGLWGSLWWDTPSGPSIVVASLGLFILSVLTPVRRLRTLFQKGHTHEQRD